MEDQVGGVTGREGKVCSIEAGAQSTFMGRITMVIPWR